MATSDLIRADTGSAADVTSLPDLLTAQAARGHTLPEKLIYDQIAGIGKMAQPGSRVEAGNTVRKQPFFPNALEIGHEGQQISKWPFVKQASINKLT